MNFGKGLITIREGLEMSTKQFADLISMTPGDVFKYEESYENMTKDDAEAICKALKLPIEMFLGLSSEIKDIAPRGQHLFQQAEEKLVEATLMFVKMENIDGYQIDIQRFKQLMREIGELFRGGL